MSDATGPVPAIEFIDVSKRYDSGILALREFSVTVPVGRMIAFLGTSGSGKTTAIRLVNRMELPTGGAVHVHGRDVASMDPIALRRSIGYVPQEGGLFPHWTVEENVALVPRLLCWDVARTRERVADVMRVTRIPRDAFGGRYPATLSGGQRQRVAIARALAAEPKLLLLDEAFGALDPITRDELHDEMRVWARELDVTTILVTHDVVEAFKLANRIVLLHEGRAVQIGTPEELVFAPVNEFVRAFFRQSGIDLRLRYLHLSGAVPYLRPCASPPGVAICRLPGTATLADALDRMAADESDCFFVTGGAEDAGPFHRRDVWRLLRAEGGEG